MTRVRARVRGLTARSRCHEDIRRVIADVNAVVRGWGQYFRTGNAAATFLQLDQYVETGSAGCSCNAPGVAFARVEPGAWRRPFFEALGLCRLRGTIQYPGSV